MIDRLIEKIKKTGSPIVVGLDPNLGYVPEFIREKAFDEYGQTLKGAAEAIWEYNKAIVDAVYDLVPAVKPQVAFYEQYGLEGLEVFKRTIDYCRDKELVVIGDIKRGDIGSTSKAYADAHIGTVSVGENTFAPFNEDFITVNPYFGSDGILPFTEAAGKANKGIFILVKTSNKSSGEFQDRLIDGRPLYEHVAKQVDAWGEGFIGENGYSLVGAVVGATYPEVGKALRNVMPHSFILVPGYGAQGATAAELRPYFDDNGLGAIVNSSRGIICAYKEEKYRAKYTEKYNDETHFADCSRQAVIAMREDLASIF
ncbi:MAG: orotidine-5'-phosphate decarboxylase [Lachnospiraceae bacterium]|nr:orotidine-5'-phosphate decarboxylase [Lachnospiraceae bacterium]